MLMPIALYRGGENNEDLAFAILVWGPTVAGNLLCPALPKRYCLSDLEL